MRTSDRRLLALLLSSITAGCATDRLHRAGMEAFDRGAYEEAIADLEQAAARHPGDPNLAVRIQLGLAEAYLDSGRRDDARKSLAEAQRLGAPEERLEPLRQRVGP